MELLGVSLFARTIPEAWLELVAWLGLLVEQLVGSYKNETT